ncbi:hypothetical protein A2442_01495 [Candidatus Campbellbacteria bacterium RIFOXYC2_FULL_35_25]|uniref:Alpha/beta hydrolase n=1 Tax=Candidatus Campbellbacteria bacterium RIFOXYC2_FULL_35_25 TaxID=1797582 RepID=A0A1F5EHJ7_9BACT|nr:MAG: hypothetical protein A2442_01495 [Candidatus Campbellbacteria bacterium RIFOXYC2_FULL_35_25]
MEKTLYIIPGLGETCRRKPYQLLAKKAKEKGYEVIFKNVDWNQKLSLQTFSVSKDDIIFGFSLGAVLAWLVAQDYKCRHIILASMTPHYSWKDKEIKKALIDLLGLKFVNDVIKKLDSKHQAKRQTIMYGDLENEKGDIIVSKTEHELTENYLKEIEQII